MSQPTTLTKNGIEYHALPSTQNECEVKGTKCAFGAQGREMICDQIHNNSGYNNRECRNVIWLTKQDFINHRMTA